MRSLYLALLMSCILLSLASSASGQIIGPGQISPGINNSSSNENELNATIPMPDSLVVFPDQILPETVIISMIATYKDTSTDFEINKATINKNNYTLYASSTPTSKNDGLKTQHAMVTLDNLTIGKYNLEIVDQLTGEDLYNSPFYIRPFGQLFEREVSTGSQEACEDRGAVKRVVDRTVCTWTHNNLAGFFYDLDNDLGNEKLTMVINGNTLEKPRGVVYATKSQEKKFEFEPWGKFKVIGFLGEEYFAGYSNGSLNGINPVLYERSENSNLLSDQQLSEVLIDDDSEETIETGAPLVLKDGYELGIRSVDDDGKKVYLELTRNGETVDYETIQPSIEGATLDDETYCYKKDVGDTSEMVTIAVHFKDAFHSSGKDIATTDGVFQISDEPKSIDVNEDYGRMRVASVDSDQGIIIMDNQDNPITLAKSKDLELMPGFRIKTADQEEISAANPLRFYVYRSDDQNSEDQESDGDEATGSWKWS
jgi:S-layer protein (TIGR01567 family)